MPRPDLFKAPIVVLDTETTGFAKYDWARVVEVAAVVLDIRGHVQETLNLLVSPDIFDAQQAAGAIKVHGITPEKVRSEGVPTDVAARRLCELLDWWFKGEPAWATSFNMDFDRPMIARMGGDLPLRWVPNGCIMKRAMSVMGPAGALPKRPDGSYKFPRLSEAMDFFGLAFQGDPHRALTDTLAAAEVLVAVRLHELGERIITHDMERATS